MTKTKIHIISHTHWDREWFLPATYTSPWLVQFFDKLFALLDKYKDYKFVLDGQVQIIEDYLNELKGDERKQKEVLIERYMKEGRLLIGPYWAQIDWQIPGAESIVRNLLLADRYLKRYGKKMKTGWLPDTFGQVGQAPQIHKLSGIDGVFVWRGVEFPHDNVKSEFEWRSPSGDKVVAVYFLASYRNLMGLTSYPEIAEPRMKNEIEKIRPFASTNNLFLMNGYDLDNSPEYPLSVIDREKFREYEIFQSDPETYIKSIEKEEPHLQILHGELLSGRYLSVFPGKLSTRAYLKVENYKCEYLLSKIIEPIGVFSWIFSGFYPQDKINKLWKELILDEIHDNISGVGVDQIHRRMEESYKYIMSEGDGLLKKILSYLITYIRGRGYIVFNTNTFPISSYPVETEDTIYTVEDIPSLGFKKEESIKAYKIERKEKEISAFEWENEFYKAFVSLSGTLTLYDKATGKTYRDLGFLYDEKDTGDEYNWSYSEENIYTTTKEKNAEIKLIYKTPVSSKVRISHNLGLPDNPESPISYEIIFDNTPLIKYKVYIENKGKEHRLKMVFPFNGDSPEIWAHMPFEYVKRPEFMDNSRPIPERFSRIFIGARECNKDYEFPMNDSVSLLDEKGFLSLLPKGLREYEVRDEELHLTLFRSVGWISNGEIKTRTGDAGPLMYTPDAYCIGRHEYEFALFTGKGRPDDREFRYWKELYHNPPIIVSLEKDPGGKIEELSLFEEKELEVTGIKVAEDKDGFIIRGFNPHKERLRISLKDGNDVELVNLLEDSMNKDIKELLLAPYEIISLKFKKTPGSICNPYTSFSIISPVIKGFTYERDIVEKDQELNFLTNKKESLKREIEQLKDKLHDEKGVSYHKTLFRILSLERTYLEIVLSLLLNEEIDLPEGEEKERLQEKIKEIGLKLNTARIKRRAYEYVLDYYLHSTL